jgi:catechol 2,3-dioxygenase-like lactoylglutathione lyase family enzyme
MKLLVAGAMALMVLAGSARAADAPVSSLMTVKIGVTDFKKATEFYVNFLGMKEGAQYNAAEKAVEWPTPGQGSNIILVNDPAGKIAKLAPGNGWLLFKVPDAKKVGRAIADAGFKVEPVVEIKEMHSTVVTARDPDGNVVELLQIGPAQ